MVDIKLFRKDNNLTQVELAEILECSQGFVCSMEKSRRPVPDKIIAKILSYGKYNTRYLTQEEDVSENTGNNETDEEVTMSREVFNILKNLSETVLSQQRIIEQVHICKGTNNDRQKGYNGTSDANNKSLAR